MPSTLALACVWCAACAAAWMHSQMLKTSGGDHGTMGPWDSHSINTILYMYVEKLCPPVTGLCLQEFNTVMSALKSNNDRWGIFDVTLVFRKP